MDLHLKRVQLPGLKRPQVDIIQAVNLGLSGVFLASSILMFIVPRLFEFDYGARHALSLLLLAAMSFWAAQTRHQLVIYAVNMLLGFLLVFSHLAFGAWEYRSRATEAEFSFTWIDLSSLVIVLAVFVILVTARIRERRRRYRND
jgi:heme/copper-type cytochrome/quinol oxidase subunit 2